MLRLFPPPHLAEEAQALATRHPSLSGLVFATSGTSSKPKWVLHSQEGIDWCAHTVNDHFHCSSKDVWGLALPEFHVGGYCLTHRAKIAGGRLARFPKRWQPLQFQEWLSKEAVTLTSLVPTQIFDLVKNNLHSPPHLRVALIGGEHLALSLFERALELGWPLVTSYGMTETAGLIAASHPGQNQLHPLRGWTLATTVQNQLTIDGPGLFQSYLTSNDPSPIAPPFITKDIVEIVKNIITIKGRSDEQIKILGELVDLQPLRQSLSATLPEYQTALCALPDSRRGHLLVPVIEAHPSSLLEQQVQTWNDQLPAFSRCQAPIFLPSWPRTPLGKTDLKTLHSQVTREQSSRLPTN